VTGIVYDQTIGADTVGGGFFLAPVQGYIDLETAEWLGMPGGSKPALCAVAGDPNDEAYINAVAARVRERVEHSGVTIYTTNLQRSDEHPNSTYVDAIAGVLLLLGLLVVFLSGFLITNTLSALMAQQVGQIGVMKTVGGQRAQIMGIYMTLIFIFGLLAFLIAMPLSQQAAYGILEFLSERINFTLQGNRLVAPAILLQIVIACNRPPGSWFHTHLARLALDSPGGAQRTPGQQDAPAEKAASTGALAQVRGFSASAAHLAAQCLPAQGPAAADHDHPDLRGAIFIATFNVQVSLSDYIDRLSKYFLADVNLTLDRPYRIERISQELEARCLEWDG
jgi:putative ABC transport system permease protein